MKLLIPGMLFTVFMLFSYSGFTQMNPKYAATIGGEWSGPMIKGQFLAQNGVGASQKVNSYHWEKIKVDSFSISVFRDSTMVFMYKNTGNIFEEGLKLLLKSIVAGDKVLVFDIHCRDLEKKVCITPAVTIQY